MDTALYILKQWGVKKIKVLSLVCTQFALNKLAAANPDVSFHVGAIDAGESAVCATLSRCCVCIALFVSCLHRALIWYNLPLLLIPVV